MYLIVRVVLFFDHWTQAMLSLKMGMGLERNLFLKLVQISEDFANVGEFPDAFVRGVDPSFG